MSNFSELKGICEEKKVKVSKLKSKIDNEIIRRDLKLLVDQIGGYDNPKSDQYINSSIEMRIDTKNGILEIIDRRKSAFLWCFEVLYKEINLRLGDAAYSGTSGQQFRKHPDTKPEVSGHFAG